MMAQAIGIAIVISAKRQGNSPLPFKNPKDQNMGLWLLQCEEYFKRNSNQGRSHHDCIKYALGRMGGEKVLAFAFTCRNKMTGELGHLRIASLRILGGLQRTVHLTICTDV